MKNYKIIPPLSAFFVFIISLAACSSPVQIQAKETQINTLPSHNINVTNKQKIIKLHYRTSNTNSENPHYVFVHGTPGSAEGWSDFLLSAPNNKYYIAIDRLGFGKSQPKHAITSLKTQAKAIATILEKNNEKAILIGHSLGGPIVTQVALDYPDKVKAIIIIAGSLDPDLEKIVLVQYLAQIWPFSAILPRHIKNANKELLALKKELIVLNARLHELKTPTVIVHGTKDSLVPYANVAFMEKRFNNVAKLEVISLADKNHFLPWNAVGAINKAILMSEQMVVSSE